MQEIELSEFGEIEMGMNKEPEVFNDFYMWELYYLYFPISFSWIKDEYTITIGYPPKQTSQR